MATTPKVSLAEIVGTNNWASISWLESIFANMLFNNRVIDRNQPNAQSILNAWNEKQDNIPSVIDLGYISYIFKEFNIPVIGNTEPDAIDPKFLTLKTKTFYGNQWYAASTIQKDLIRAQDPITYLNQFVGRVLTTQLNQTICSTLGGMSDITEITVGGADVEFSEELVEQASGLKGDAGYKGFKRFYMHSDTLKDIRSKQRSGTIKDVLIAPIKAQERTSVKIDGSSAGTSLGQYMDTSLAGESEMAYLGSTSIVLDNSLTAGVISIVEDGAFAFVQQEFNNPLSYEFQAKANFGIGREEMGIRYAYIMHPIGFNFKGVLGTSYANGFGLSMAELSAGNQYELGFDIKKCKILQMKVKIGTD